MASDQAEIVFTLVREILRKVLEFNGDESIQYIDQDNLYFRVEEMFCDCQHFIDPANIVEILTSEMIIFTLSKKEECTNVMDEQTDEARILNTVDYASLIPKKHTTLSVEAGRHATHSIFGNRNVQIQTRKNIEKSDSNEELSSLHTTSHSTYQDVIGDDSSSSIDTGVSHVRTGAIPKRRIERKKWSLAVDYVVSLQDKKPKGYAHGNYNELDQSFEKESRHNTVNISERDTPRVSPPRKVQLSEAVCIKSKIQAADIRENSVIGGKSSRVAHVDNDENLCSEQYIDSITNDEDTREKNSVGMTSRKEMAKKDFSINKVSSLSKNSCKESIDSVLGSQSDPCNLDSHACVNITDDISEAVEDASSGVDLMAADHLRSDDVKHDSDEDTSSMKSHETDLYSCYSESEFEMCDDTTDAEAASSCNSVSEKVDASVYSTPTSESKNHKSSEDEISLFSLIPTADTSQEKESLKLLDCEGDDDDDTCEEFSILSEALSLNEFSSSVACDNLFYASFQDDERSVSQSEVECDVSDVLLISSSEHSSNESISILQADGEDIASLSALNEDFHDLSVMVLDSPIFMDRSPSGHNLLENSADPPENDKSVDSLFMHAAVDKTMAQTSQSVSFPTEKTKHAACTRSSVKKTGTKHDFSTVSSTHLTKGSIIISPIELDNERASSSDGNASLTSDLILTEISVKKKTAQPSSSQKVSLISSQCLNENAVKVQLTSPLQSPVVSAATATSSSRTAGQSHRNIIRISAFCNAGREYKLQNDSYDGEIQLSEPNMTGVEYIAASSITDGKPCSFDETKEKLNRTLVQPEDWMATHCKTLFEIFPDVDENYLLDRCQELTSSEGRFDALLNELVLIENKPTKELVAGGEQYHSPRRHMMSLDRNCPSPCRPARPSEDILDLEATTVDGMPLFDWLQKEEYGAAQAAPRPEEEALECGCCCNSYPVEEMRHCEGDQVHLFCHNCIRRYCENQIGQTEYEMHCLSVNNCSALFSVSTLLNVLPAPVYKNLMSNKQAEEIKAANIDDLETCPFCHFSLIFDNKATMTSPNIVFRCDNSDCGKRSCRLCKKADHSPAKCDEVRAQTDARTHLENEMTEAMVSSQPAKSFGWVGLPTFLQFWRSGPTCEPQQQESQHEQQQPPLQQQAMNSLASSEDKGFQDADDSVSPRASLDFPSAPPLTIETEQEGGTFLPYDGTNNGCKIAYKKRSLSEGSDHKSFGQQRSDHKSSNPGNGGATVAPSAFGGLATAATALATASAVANMTGYRNVGAALNVVSSAVARGRVGGMGEVSLGTLGAAAGAREVSLTNGGSVTAGAKQSMPPRRSRHGPRFTFGLNSDGVYACYEPPV